MSKHGEIYDSVEKVVAKLYILKDSCAGVLNSEKSKPNSLWFQGAGAMLSETVDELQQTLHTIESGEEEKAVVSEGVEEEAPVEETESEEGEESPEAKE
jgi:primosomal protein N''